MKIEFNVPTGKVKEWVMTYLMNKLMILHNHNENISKIEVELIDAGPTDKHCAINLHISNTPVLVKRNAGTYEESCLNALIAAEEKLNEMSPQQKSPAKGMRRWRIKRFA
jgi:hypothetical protein